MAKKENFPSIDSATTDTGLRRIYRKGCKAHADADAAQTTETLHEWRKQVKYLLNAVEGLHTSKRGNAADNVAKILKRADQLAEYLGDDHELAMLAQETARGTYASVDADVIKRLHALIDSRRAKLQQRAFRSGKKLYDRKPKKFAEQAGISPGVS